MTGPIGDISRSDQLVPDTQRELDFAKGYLQAMDLMIAHWPEDRKCRCDPVMSGEWTRCGHTRPTCIERGLDKCKFPEHTGPCWTYCWVKEIHRTSAINAGEDEGYANTSR